jgi:hypothetical protein
MTWLDVARQMTTVDVAERLGFAVKRSPSASSTSCPACGEERRHTKSRDRRGAIGIPHKTGAWHCHQCEASGDAIDFVSYVLCDKRYRELDVERKSEVREWFEPGSSSAPYVPPKPRAKPVELSPCFENADADYAPIGEVEDLWDGCADVMVDHEAMDYLRFRSIALGVEDFDTGGVARALQPGPLPGWAGMAGRNWVETGHRLIVPLYSHHGALRSVVARSVKRSPAIKSSGPAFGRRGLVMAGPVAQAVLRLGSAGRFHARRKLEVIVHEGEIDFLTFAHLDAEDCRADGVHGFTAVFGIQAGSWTRDVASRIPSGSVVRVRTHDDDAGRKYADQIEAALSDRMTCNRELVAP